jgi:hypothetical protein
MAAPSLCRAAGALDLPECRSESSAPQFPGATIKLNDDEIYHVQPNGELAAFPPVEMIPRQCVDVLDVTMYSKRLDRSRFAVPHYSIPSDVSTMKGCYSSSPPFPVLHFGAPLSQRRMPHPLENREPIPTAFVIVHGVEDSW